MAILKLTSPWITYYNELKEMFKLDPDVHVFFDNDELEVKLYVEKDKKADALSKLLPTAKTFGTNKLKISVIPANDQLNAGIADYEEAFKGNGALSYVKKVNGIFDLVYIVFKNKVVQYFNDDLGDVNGMCSTLYQDIAKRIFETHDGVFFCTDIFETVYENNRAIGLKSRGKQVEKWP